MGERIEALKAAFNIGSAAFTKAPGRSLQERMQHIFKPIWSEPPRRATAQWIDLYMKSPRMNPVHKISTDVALANYRLYTGNKRDQDTWEEIINHPLLNLLENPIPEKEFTGYNLIYLTQVYLLLPAGEAFWLVERNGLGMPTELWIIPPHWVMETPTRDTPYFKILAQGNTTYRQILVDPADMIWIKEPNPLNPYGRGRGRTEAIGDEIETDENMAKYQKKFFYNDAIPPAVGTAPGADETSIKRMDAQWHEKYGGTKNAHKIAWLPWDAKIQILKESNKEMDFVESRKYLRDTANQFWGIPPELFGIQENSNRSTIDAAYYIYTKNVLSGRLNALDEAISRQLIPMFDARLFLRHDNVVPDDEEFKLKKDTEGLKYGAVLVDEWRTSQGKKPLPDKKGQMLYVPLNMTPFPLDETLQQVQEQQQNPPEKGLTKSFDDKKKDVIWKLFDKAAIKYEKSFEKAVKKYFQQQQDKLISKVPKKSHLPMFKSDDNEDNTEEYAAILAAISIVISEEQNKLLFEAMNPLWIESIKEGFNLANDAYGFGLDTDDFANRLTQWVKENGFEKVKGINETTRSKLQKTLEEGINSGESIPKLRDRISAVYSEAKTSRAEKIARTETANSVNYGTYESLKFGGIKKKQWLTSRDQRVRDTHSLIDGQVRDLNKPFSNGLMHPGDANGPASEVILCRCTLIPVWDEEE